MMSDDEFLADHQEEDYDGAPCEDDDQEYDSDEENYPGSDSDDDRSNNVLEYSILSGQDIGGLVDKDILEISSLLSVSKGAALVLLCKYGWNVSRIHEEWFSDEGKTRKDCGLMVLEDSVAKRKVEGMFFCGICLEEYNAVNHRAVMAACDHVFCETCWRTYISTSIKDGPGCLSIRCPQPSCGASIGDMIGWLASDEDRVKYENQVLRSYVEGRKNIKWCPAPGCDFAVELECFLRENSGSYCNYEVTCNCSYGFCWNCSEEAHSPANCETVAKWILKNGSEAGNTNWMLTNTKTCPKCHKRIEKNRGCMHMRCRPPCDFQFCWLCLGPWSEHGQKTGGYYGCNRYEAAKTNGEYNKANEIREMAKNSLEKYTHFFERWIGNHTSRRKALKDIKELPTKHLQNLRDMHYLTMSQLQFITDAWVQIVECRRVLKWSYAFGYYLPEDETARKKFFEYLQGEAEFNLERLHSLVENELSRHSRGEAPRTEFRSFCAKVVDLTTVTRNYFDNLVTALANGLSDES